MPVEALGPPGQPRRSVLKKGLWGGALLALGGSGFLLSRDSRRVASPGRLSSFDDVEAAVVHGIALRLIPERSGFPSIDDLSVVQTADQILAKADAGARAELKQLLKLFENALTNFVFGGRVRPFTQLTAQEQDQVLLEWRDSRLTLRRTGYQAIRTLILASYYSSSQSWPAVGYKGPPQGFHQPDSEAWTGIGPRPRSEP